MCSDSENLRQGSYSVAGKRSGALLRVSVHRVMPYMDNGWGSGKVILVPHGSTLKFNKFYMVTSYQADSAFHPFGIDK